MYKEKSIVPFGSEDEFKTIIRLSDNAIIPTNIDNKDYQIYLKWLSGYEYVGGEYIKTSDGNTPLNQE